LRLPSCHLCQGKPNLCIRHNSENVRIEKEKQPVLHTLGSTRGKILKKKITDVLGVSSCSTIHEQLFGRNLTLIRGKNNCQRGGKKTKIMRIAFVEGRETIVKRFAPCSGAPENSIDFGQRALRWIHKRGAEKIPCGPSIGGETAKRNNHCGRGHKTKEAKGA